MPALRRLNPFRLVRRRRLRRGAAAHRPRHCPEDQALRVAEARRALQAEGAPEPHPDPRRRLR